MFWKLSWFVSQRNMLILGRPPVPATEKRTCLLIFLAEGSMFLCIASSSPDLEFNLCLFVS